MMKPKRKVIKPKPRKRKLRKAWDDEEVELIGPGKESDK